MISAFRQADAVVLATEVPGELALGSGELALGSQESWRWGLESWRWGVESWRWGVALFFVFHALNSSKSM